MGSLDPRTSLESRLSRKERAEAGKALRDACPRTSHAEWRPPKDRPDPVALLEQSSEGRIPELVPIRYGRMVKSPFIFYRGAAMNMAADLATTPASGIRVQAASDLFLGWTEGRHGRHFYVRQLRDMKIKPLVEIFQPSDMLRYAKFCGWILARAHARSGDPAAIGGYLGKSDKFDEAIATFSVAYADQTEHDHAVLKEAVSAGRIDVILEDT